MFHLTTLLYNFYFIFRCRYLMIFKKLILKTYPLSTPKVGVLNVEFALKLRIYRSLKSLICLKWIIYLLCFMLIGHIKILIWVIRRLPIPLLYIGLTWEFNQLKANDFFNRKYVFGLVGFHGNRCIPKKSFLPKINFLLFC